MASSRDIARAVLFEQYRRDFQKFAIEQLKIKGAAPGDILPLDIERKPFQVAIWRKCQEQLKTLGFVRGVGLKGRQQGGTSGTQGFSYWKASTTANFDTLLMAQDADSTTRIFNIARHYYEHTNPAFRPMIRFSSKIELVFENPDARTRYQNPGLRSRMDFVDASKKFPGTGLTRHGLHLSETAKYPEDTTHLIVSSILPALHDLPGTFMISESTAFVTGEWFHAECDEARSGKSRKFWVFSPWFNDPEYRLTLKRGEHFIPTREEEALIRLAARGQKRDEVAPIHLTKEQLKWRREKIREFELAGITSNGAEWFSQEYPTTPDSAWISAELFVFNRELILELERKAANNPPRTYHVRPGRPPTVYEVSERFDLETNYHAVWQLPELNKQYDLGVDVSAGVEGGDWSVIQIVERFTLRQVAEIHLLVDGPDLADEIYWWGAFYNWGQVAVEYNAEGITVGQFLQRKEYPYFYFWRTRSGAYPKITKTIGWKTSRDSKIYLVATYRSKFQRKEMEIRSRWLLREMSNYIQIPSGEAGWSYRGQSGHDDRVMAMGISIVTSEDESQGSLPEAEREIRAASSHTQILDIAMMEPGIPAGPNQRAVPDEATKRRIIDQYQRALGIWHPRDDLL